jgi:vacuolar-type H+-ATPase subunit E/Vma4
MKPLGSVAAVVAAIHEDATVEVEGITRQVEADIARLHGDDAARAVTFAEGDMQIAAARERSRARLAQEDWLDSRAAIDEREQWLARVVELGQRRLERDQAPDFQKQRLARLAQECIGRLQSAAVEVVVSPADSSLLDETWQTQLITANQLESLRVSAGDIHGGCLVRTQNGRASFDNTYPSRADRFRTAWRAALAELYEQAVRPIPPSAALPPHRR